MYNKKAFWRFNPQILTEPSCCDYLKLQMKIFFETNETPGISATLLWETFKAFIRGCIISYQAFQNKKNRTEQLELEKIKQLDLENAIDPTTAKHNKIAALKFKLNQILSAKIIMIFQYTKQKNVEFGDKPHKLLAPQIREGLHYSKN